MVWQNKYPICEFDTNKNPMLEELHALEHPAKLNVIKRQLRWLFPV